MKPSPAHGLTARVAAAAAESPIAVSHVKVSSIVAAGCALFASAAAAIECEHFELAELKQMSRQELELKYCIFEDAKSGLNSLRKIANDELVLEAKYGRFEGPEGRKNSEEARES